MNCIELFAGAGGLALGLEQAGIEVEELVEFDKDCCATLKKNRPNWNVINEDIHNVSFLEYKDKIDLISGGIPCQAYSSTGKELGFADKRGTLFKEFARCVEEVRPKIFMIENVKGLVTHDKGKTLEIILDTFRNLGYNIEYRVLNACYFGVGQKRERVIIIGMKDKFTFGFPTPSKAWTTLKDTLQNCPISEGEQYSESKRKIMELIPQGGNWRNLSEDVCKQYMGKAYFAEGGKTGYARRIAWDEPCLTLTTSPSQKQTERCHPTETRPFTIREYARIQSFPDDWEFCGSMSSQYKQIGNAVPVEFARRIGLKIREVC